MDVDHVFVADPRGVPDGVDELAAAEGDAGLGGQDSRMSNSVRVSATGVVADPDFARGGVDPQVAEHAVFVPCGGGGGWPAGLLQHRLDAGDQFAGTEGLGEVVVGAHGQSDQPVHLVGAGGQHEDVAVAEGTDTPAHLDTVEAG